MTVTSMKETRSPQADTNPFEALIERMRDPSRKRPVIFRHDNWHSNRQMTLVVVTDANASNDDSHNFVHELKELDIVRAIVPITQGGLACAVAELARSLRCGFAIELARAETSADRTASDVLSDLLYSDVPTRYLLAIPNHQVRKGSDFEAQLFRPSNVEVRAAGRLDRDTHMLKISLSDETGLLSQKTFSRETFEARAFESI
ncbi:hypothetical protein [Ponticaulis sp.]|uniref:hypothetical protein n=1 Tax=Ponticaulis sp. TaxID=2020902 RepID=UPI00260EF7D2|nr:hypothetical protein [Ponticaulis sp.]MDF1680698.1 hypothetical protein [Ponticaulis sp.]